METRKKFVKKSKNSQILFFNLNTSLFQEQALLDRLAQGDQTAFWPLWLQYQDYLYCRCRTWMAGNSTDTEEAVSRAMLKAWQKLPIHASKITNAKAWLICMTHNLCIDIHRKRQRKTGRTVNLEAVAYKEDYFLVSEVESPELTLLNSELRQYTQRAINTLPPRLRETVILRFCQEKSYADIARQLSLSEANVRKRIQQARAILKQQLQSYLMQENFSGV